LRFTGEEFMNSDGPDRKLLFTDRGNVTDQEINDGLEYK
jgi:hypothetical protein